MIAIAAPAGRDAQVIDHTLSSNGIPCAIIKSLDVLLAGIRDGELAGAIVAEEALRSIESAVLERAIAEQPPWSDFPLVILTFKGSPPSAGSRAIERMGNVSLLERPLHPAALMTAARGILRSRSRQQEVRELLFQRQEAQENLQALNNLRDLFEKAPGFIAVTFGPDHRFEMANEASRNLVQRPLIGRTVREALPEIIEQGYLDILDEVYRSGKPFFGQELPMYINNVAGEREEHFLTFVYQPIIGSDGRVKGLFAEGADATERRRAQDKVLILQNELIQMSRLSAMGAMASTLSHEVNQPLTAVANYLRGSLTLLEKREPETLADVAYAIGEAEKNALRAGEVIRHARELVIGSSNQQASCELAPVVREALELATIGATAGGLECRTHYAKGLRVLADRIQIQQVVMNLVRNAIEAMADSALRILDVSTQRAGDMAEVVVSDTGVGLDPAARSRLFQPFITSKEEGMGLGLSISRTIIEAHGGTISAGDTPDGGAVFRFTLKLDPDGEP